jgi:DNA-3-methyladenine glycosylase II
VAGRQLDIDPLGQFSLRAAAGFGFGPNEGRPPPFAGVMRLAFPVDGDRGYAGVALRQEADDAPVRVELDLGGGGADPQAAVRQVARILSLDHDGRGFAAVGERDPVLGRLQRAHPGQRPVLFHSPYEAAAWSVISARRPAAQAAGMRRALAEELGQTFTLAGETLAAFPRPERLLDLEPRAGLPAEKVERLHGIARAALAGDLDVARLQELGPERAFEDVQRLRGIGPFYAGLIVVRAAGFADAMLTVPERKGLAHVGRYYGLGPAPTLAEVAALAERWRPFRTWAIVLIRLAGDRGTP